MPHPVAVAIDLTEAERAALEQWAAEGAVDGKRARRARIVLAAAAGLSNREIAEQLGLSRPTAARWRRRFSQRGLSGLVDAPRSGRPRVISDRQVAEVVVRTLVQRPANAQRWSTRSMAAEVGLSQNAVLRIWRRFGLRPHEGLGYHLTTPPTTVSPALRPRPR